jgi:hypothetical protein
MPFGCKRTQALAGHRATGSPRLLRDVPEGWNPAAGELKHIRLASASAIDSAWACSSQ